MQTSKSISGPFSYDRLLRNAQHTFEDIVNGLDPALAVNDKKTAGKRIHEYSDEVIVAEEIDNIIHFGILASTIIDGIRSNIFKKLLNLMHMKIRIWYSFIKDF